MQELLFSRVTRVLLVLNQNQKHQCAYGLTQTHGVMLKRRNETLFGSSIYLFLG